MNNNSIRVAVLTGCTAKFSENIHHALFSICHSHNPCRLQFPLPWPIGFFTGVIRRMPLVEQDLLSWPLVNYVLSKLLKYICLRASYPCCDIFYVFRAKRCSVRLSTQLFCKRFILHLYHLCFMSVFNTISIADHVLWCLKLVLVIMNISEILLNWC